MNTNYKKVKLVLWVILFLNIVVAVAKIIIGTIAKSASLTADGFHSISDGSSNIVGLIGIHYSSKPVDENHPYGHQKFETLASLFISFLLAFMALKIVYEGILRIYSPVSPEITFLSITVLFLTLIINIFVSSFEYKKGKQLKSSILITDSKHTKSDIFITIGVLCTIIGIKLGLPIIFDTIISLIVSLFILHAAYEIFKSTSAILVDEIGIDSQKILDLCYKFPEIKNIHKIRSRRCENIIYIDLHIVTEPNLNIEESHTLVHSLEKSLNNELNENIEIIAHLEPYKY